MSPLTTDDRCAILELLSRYSHAIDSGSAEEFASLFTTDGTWDGPGGRHTGSRQLASMLLAYREHPDVRSSRHWVSGTTLAGQSDHVVATSYSLCVGPGPSGDDVIVELIGKYLDVIVREDGAWRFKSRHVVDVHPRAVTEFQLEEAQ